MGIVKNKRCLFFVFPWLLTLLLTFACVSLQAQDVIQLKIGSLHSWFRADGNEPEEGFIKIQQTGLEWPALYQDQDNQAAKALWIATKNYKDADQYGGNNYLHKVVHVGPRGWDTEREFMPIEFKLIGRHDHPQVFVDGLPSSELMFAESVDEVDENLISDRLIYNVVNTSIGLTLTRRIYAWGQQYHDNYFIYEYVFKNTGNVDPDPEIEQQVTLEDVYFFFQYRYAASREGATWTDLNSPRWGINEMLSTRGEAKSSDGDYPGDYEDWLNGNANADSMRVQFAWMGYHSGAAYDLIASPDVKYGTGRLGSPQFIGNITLHADKSATEKNDDPQQPTTTTYQQSDDPPTRPNDQFDAARMSEEWAWITRGHRLPRHDEVVGEGFPDLFEGTPGGFSNMNGYGPYTLAPGDSIRLVIAEGVNGLNRQLCEEIGAKWIEAYRDESTTYSFELPDGSTTTDKDEYKNTWFFTGRDSLFKTLGRARRNFETDFNIPLSPPPPSIFEVNSGGDRIRLSWANNAETHPGFAGYRVYRAVAKFDTTYDVIFECGPGTANPQIVNEYDDTTPVRGFAYYYYITSFDDGSNNSSPANPGGELESSLFWTQTTQPAMLSRAAGTSLDSIRVVPNPYDIRSRALQFPGEPDKIAFYDIPGQCTIKIYTERGDLIKTIIHDDGSGDESWNSVTEYGQIIVSGVYIVTFETPNGDRAIRKFIVIR
ncbi:fibronectin [candidate division KSB1 bacterium]|nr:fibronectin [candidate division KSB1 bacterium]